MQYAILCYDSESVVGSWSKEKDDAVMAKSLAAKNCARRARQNGPDVAALANDDCDDDSSRQ